MANSPALPEVVPVMMTLTPGSGSLVAASVTRPRTPPPWATAAKTWVTSRKKVKFERPL